MFSSPPGRGVPHRARGSFWLVTGLLWSVWRGRPRAARARDTLALVVDFSDR
jgi:hypothetical protein